MMMDFNGNNRGYAFVTFSTKKEAKAAMKHLNNYEIRSEFGLFRLTRKGLALLTSRCSCQSDRPMPRPLANSTQLIVFCFLF